MRIPASRARASWQYSKVQRNLTPLLKHCYYERGVRVPNAPKSCIAEIFSADKTDGAPMKNGTSRPRAVRDTPTRPRDTHSRLFGQAKNNTVVPMVTDNIRSHIQFGEHERNGGSPMHSPKMNGSASSTPSRGEGEPSDLSISASPPKRNPVTGDGVLLPPPRRAHPGAAQRGAHHDLLDPQPTHRYITKEWPPHPAHYYVESMNRPALSLQQTPYSLIGLQDLTVAERPKIDPNSLSPQPVIDRHWPPFPAQHYLEPSVSSEHTIPYHPLPPHAFVGMTSALGERPKPDYKYNPVPSLDGPIDPFLISNLNPPPSLFKYEKDGPIPDYSLLQTEVTPGPHTLTGFPPIFRKHVPGFLYGRHRDIEDFAPKTSFVDYVRQREMEGNPITGQGYKSLNGQINTVTSLNGSGILHNRVPPGGYSSGLW
ncbi:unnamed protein product [Plutella xylostella]|uniref:(diamondback moth) hypothetical protein n=1 Tax=Plutella xylostella TaxID=51655 RepID=A0A8S4EAC3_PLUXY|nr:unnamed protein product [Plutella xylostella]